MCLVGAAVSLAHLLLLYFFCNDPATTATYTLSLHDALPISTYSTTSGVCPDWERPMTTEPARSSGASRSEEHTSELQSRENLVCRLLLEKKKKKKKENRNEKKKKKKNKKIKKKKIR